MNRQKELLFSVTKKDFRVETYRGTGPGGQHRNKTDSCVRITHIESSAVAQACESRHQAENKKAAFNRLLSTVKWKVWYAQRVLDEQAKLDGLKTLEQQVQEQMREENLKIEVYREGEWTNESRSES